ncbi:hypothetical protein GCM10023192_79940 [Amycolatopsis samaneae]
MNRRGAEGNCRGTTTSRPGIRICTPPVTVPACTTTPVTSARVTFVGRDGSFTRTSIAPRLTRTKSQFGAFHSSEIINGDTGLSLRDYDRAGGDGPRPHGRDLLTHGPHLERINRP